MKDIGIKLAFPNRKATELTADEKVKVKTFRDQCMLTHEDRRNARIRATKEAYAKCILFDYSYKFFYEDGYGKESLILNMNGEAYDQADNAQKYFTACLLSFYQQLWLWSSNQGKLTDFNIEKPLWVFVGNTVSGEDSDILEVVNFLAFFLNEEAKVRVWLSDLVTDKAQILDAKGNNIFKNRFTPLMDFAGREFDCPKKISLALANFILSLCDGFTLCHSLTKRGRILKRKAPAH